MSRYFLAFLCASALSWPRLASSQVPVPPLPGKEGEAKASTSEAFSLLPAPDEAPPESLAPGEPDPIEPPPQDLMPQELAPGEPSDAGDPANAGADQFLDIEPLGMPSDGEPLPEMPEVPGLILPKQRPALPGGGGIAPEPNPLPDLLPAPNFQLAKKSLWYRSPIEARAVSRKEKKPLLIFFAQLWDGPCPTAHLNDDLFTMSEFNEFASARLILTKVQYPIGSPGKNYSEARLKKLQEAKDYFKVRGFPTVVMIDENGRELERIKGSGRVKNPATGQEFSSAHVFLDRLKEAEHRHSERRRYVQERIDNLTAQGYRIWTSRVGSTMMGKLVEATPQRIILKDEAGRWRQVLPSQLILYDAEWARRKQAGLIPDPKKSPGTVSLTSRP